MTAFIRLENVSKAFGPLTVVKDLNLEIEKGEFVSMLGPSGSGKTTLLMMLGGFERPTSGAVWVNGKRIDALPPYRRNMGVVFQNYALFPHMTVGENVAFPLKMRKVARAKIAEQVSRALDMVQLGSFAARKPSQLSGGQQQRVALARSLVFQPEIVLMDEPLGALDKKLREQMQLDIRELHRRLGLTIVFVTHDQTEALTMSDRIAVFNHGKIEHIGTPAEIYDRPRTRFVAEFIGETNMLAGQVESVAGDTAQVRLASGQQVRVAASAGLRPKADICFSIRPERLRVGSGDGAQNELDTTVTDIVYHGDHLQLLLRAGDQQLLAKADRSGKIPEAGAPLAVSFSASDCWIVA
ncbi:MAG: Fe3+/spermidine/putrescine ABC transporter ATP-binding protein [Kaistia sp. SCN 65-12]|nr:MAG: Fe3+/spermidine/putrescine ABC transporter ATP-binding protein [Kaistia sp. SCN 65-12]